MAFDKKTIIDIGKSLEEAENLEKTINDMKLEEARLKKDIKIYNNSLKDEQEKLALFIKGKIKIKEDTEKEITILQSKRASISSDMSSEVIRLNSLANNIKSQEASLNNREIDLTKRSNLLSNEQKVITDKKMILDEIIKLASKL